MSIIAKNNDFSDAATISASAINANFDTIYNNYNGGITNANLATNAAIAYSKLTLTGSIQATDIKGSAVAGTHLTTYSAFATISGTNIGTFAHSLGAAPAFVSVLPYSILPGSFVPRISTIDGTNIIISNGTETGTSIVKLYAFK